MYKKNPCYWMNFFYNSQKLDIVLNKWKTGSQFEKKLPTIQFLLFYFSKIADITKKFKYKKVKKRKIVWLNVTCVKVLMQKEPMLHFAINYSWLRMWLFLVLQFLLHFAQQCLKWIIIVLDWFLWTNRFFFVMIFRITGIICEGENSNRLVWSVWTEVS